MAEHTKDTLGVVTMVQGLGPFPSTATKHLSQCRLQKKRENWGAPGSGDWEAQECDAVSPPTLHPR